MTDTARVWGDALGRLGLVPVAAVEDGLRDVLDTPLVRIEVDLLVFRAPVTARVVVRPVRVEGQFLIAPARVVPAPTRWSTGDAGFDAAVSILSGGRDLLPRLGLEQRGRLLEVVGRLGAVISAECSSLEPAAAALLTDAQAAATAVRELARLAAELAVDPPFEGLVARWTRDDGAPAVTAAVGRRMVEVLPRVTEPQAEIVCRHLAEQESDASLALLSVMPPFACVLAAWFQVGDPLDPRVAARVLDAWRSGTHRPVARYLAWLLSQGQGAAMATAALLWETPGLAEDPSFVREFLRAIRRAPPAAALPFLLRLHPRSSSVARRLARALRVYPAAEVDRRLLEWTGAASAGVRQAAAAALVERALEELSLGGRAERLEAALKASEQCSELLQVLVRELPPEHTPHLVHLRPRAEPDAVLLLQRLARGGAEMDDALLFWLERGTQAVRHEAVRALASAGSPRAIPQLRDRASSWFSEGGVREASREALEALRRRHGGSGALALASAAGGELSLAESPRLASRRGGDL